MKKKKQPTRKTLKRKLDDIFSLYIRLRDGGICYTCGIRGEPKKMDAGHYIKRQYDALRFDERNVHCQCRKCNRFMGGNMDEYAVRLIKQYGEQILIEFDRKKREIKQFGIEELQKMIEHYRNQIKKLQNEISKCN